MVANSTPLEDERLQILRMVEEGKVSASEGVALLSALNGERKPAAAPARSSGTERPVAEERPEPEIKKVVVAAEAKPSTGGPRFFKVRVTDIETGRAKTSVTLPLALVDWGLKIGARYAPDADIDMNEIGEMLRMGIEGKLIDVVDEDDGEHVEIFVE
jgi:hypothetical protein